MTSVGDLHSQAMDAAFFADRERNWGNVGRAAELFEQALDLELAAIDALDALDESEGMGWAVLHRSAGWLALDCERPDLARRLAAKALASEPHPDITNELDDLMEQANFHRHLETRGIALSDGEVQLSLVGHAVASGLASLSDFMPRTNSLQSLIYRMVQRTWGLQYSGAIPRDIRNRYQIFVSPPRPGSFAISFRLAHSSPQTELSGFVGPAEIISEFMDLMELANSSQISEIQQHIPDPAYQRNFLGLAKKLALDGDRIRQVGFTAVKGGETRYLSVTTPASCFPVPDIKEGNQAGDSIEVSGMLRYADAGARQRNRNQIKIVNDSGPSYEVAVPEGMMDDIVRPLWNSFVTVRGSRRRRGKIIRLHEIWESEPDSGDAVGPRISITNSGMVSNNRCSRFPYLDSFGYPHSECES